MRAYGGELFDQLFPTELQNLLWTNRASIDCILVVSTEPFIPWELIHLKEPGHPLPDETLFLCQMGLVRWLLGNWPPAEVRVRDGSVRYVAPSYLNPGLQLDGLVDECLYLEE